EAADIGRKQQPLIDHGARRERRHVELGDRGQLVLAREILQRILGLLADRKQFALERVLVLDVRRVGDDRLADHWHLRNHGLAEARRIGGHVAPTDQLLALILDEALELLDDDVARLLFRGKEAHRDRVMAGPGQRHAGTLGPIAQQRVRYLDEAAGPVTDQRIGAYGATVVEIYEELQALGDDFMGFFALDAGDESDAARVMLVAGVVQTLFRRRSGHRASNPNPNW